MDDMSDDELINKIFDDAYEMSDNSLMDLLND